MKKWAQIELEDALPLLSIKFAANKYYNEALESNKTLVKVYHEIRKKAIACLESRKNNDELIKSIMLQLV
jgi:hypothetical protein